MTLLLGATLFVALLNAVARIRLEFWGGAEGMEPMLGSGFAALGPRCVLPFTAEASAVPSLRSVVRSQLAQWRVATLSEQAQLAVSELATNVFKHVGEGAAAALVMELGDTRLRVELHDKSRTLPTATAVGIDSECGRGLHLIAAMADDSGAALTATGKVVWCEFGAGPAGERCGGMPLRPVASGHHAQHICAG